MSKLSEKIEEALNPNLQGRFHDARQSVNPEGQWTVYGGDLDPMGWVLGYGANQHHEGMTLMGTVPLVLMGHRDLSDEEFDDILKKIEDRHTKPVVDPAMDYSLSAPVDVRLFVMNGEYSKQFETAFPSSYTNLSDALRVVYDTSNFPELNGALISFLESSSPFELSELKGWLKKAVKNFRRRDNHKRTSGDIHQMFWDYFRDSGSAQADDDDDFDYGSSVDQQY